MTKNGCRADFSHEGERNSDLNIVVIGCGEQGSALVKGLSRYTSSEIIGCDRNQKKLDKLEQHLAESYIEAENAVHAADIIFLAVKPSSVEKVLENLQLKEDQVLASVAAGVKMEFLSDRTDAQIFRLMPNLAASYGEMAASVVASHKDSDRKEEVFSLLEDLGEVVLVDEKLIDLSTALNGSGPAFVYYFMKQMKESAEKLGLCSEKAEKLSIQTFKGAAQIASDSKEDLDELIEGVCSPNGTTIEGIRHLRNANIGQEMLETLEKTEKRSKEIGSEYSYNFQRDFSDAERVVVKVGTSSLKNSSGIDTGAINRLAEQISGLEDREIVLVSSGAIEIGENSLNSSSRRQTASTLGQVELMKEYSECFREYGEDVAQLLVTGHDLESRERRENLVETVEHLLDEEKVPVLNENDAITTESIRVGDNDIIASKIARSLDADLLVTLTDVDGVHTASPEMESAKRLSKVKKSDERVEKVLKKAGTDSGIATKIQGARMARREGIDVVITDASKQGVLERVLNGDDLGTYFEAIE